MPWIKKEKNRPLLKKCRSNFFNFFIQGTVKPQIAIVPCANISYVIILWFGPLKSKIFGNRLRDGLNNKLEITLTKEFCAQPLRLVQKQKLRKIFSIGALRAWVDSLTLLLIIEVKINISLGFDNTDYHTNKLSNVHALHCTIVLYIVP